MRLCHLLFTLALVGPLAASGPDALAQTQARREPPIPETMNLKPINPVEVWQAVRPALAEGRCPELVEQLVALFTDPNPLQPTTGWYHDSVSRFGFDWLAGRFDGNHDGTITRAEFGSLKHPRAWATLDRDRDGRLSAEDLDWSANSPWVVQTRQAFKRFAQIDTDANGRLSPEEWAAYYANLASDKEYLSVEDIREVMVPDPEPNLEFSFNYRWNRALITLNGDIGSMFEGPGLNAPAPDFTLKTQDGQAEYSLSQFRGDRPVVLIFGSFT